MNKAERTSLEWRRFSELSPAALYEVLRFRQAIFVVEQHSPYEDLDGRDMAARHLICRGDGALCGYLRLIPEGERVRIGRLAVAPGHRRRGLGRRLIDEALAVHAREFAACPVVLSAQKYLERFYAGFGFAAVSAEYDDGGIAHIDMVRPP